MYGTHKTRAILSVTVCAALAAALFSVLLSPAMTQTIVHPPVKTSGAGGNSFDGPGAVVYPPHRDIQDRRIDMFIGDWHDSLPRHILGSLVLRDILTKGDNFNPPQKGAVLQSANFLAYGELKAGDWTTTTKLKGNQEVYYILSGTGEITSGTKTSTLRKDTAVLMPEK